MTRHDDQVRLRHMLDHAREAVDMVKGLSRVFSSPTLDWGGQGHKMVGKITAVNNAGVWVL